MYTRNTVNQLIPHHAMPQIPYQCYCFGFFFTEHVEIRLVGAVVRAGLSDVVIDNPACGSPVTRQQALSDAWIEFTCDPPRFSRYVSVDIPGMAILSLAEVQVLPSEVSTCKYKLLI